MKLQVVIYIVVFSGLLMCLLIILLWRQHTLIEKIRRGIARDLHDEFGASLSNISLLTGLVSRELPCGPEGKAQEYLDRISEEADKVHNSISDTVAVLGSSCRKLGHLAALINRHGYELLQEKGIAFSLSLPPELKEARIPASRRRDLYLLIKEALHNIMQHSEASQASVAFSADWRRLYCRINDNGRGFDPAGQHSGNGLKNMIRRARIIKGRFTVSSRPGGGCELVVSMRLRPLWYPLRLWHSHKMLLNSEIGAAQDVPGTSSTEAQTSEARATV